MAFVIAFILLLAFGIMRQRQLSWILTVSKNYPQAKSVLVYSHTLRMFQSSGTWFGAFAFGYICVFAFLGNRQQFISSSDKIALSITSIFILAGVLGSFAERALFRVIQNVPGVELDLTRYKKEVLIAQVIKWLFIVALYFCWITIVSITFAPVE